MYVCMYVCMVITYTIAKYGSTGWGCQSCSWSAEQGKIIFPCPRTCLRIWSRETGSAVPSLISLLILHTQAESGAYSRDSYRFPRRRPFIYLDHHTPSGQCRLYRVTQLCTNDVHCRESAGKGPVVLEIVPLTGAAILQVTMDQLISASLFPHPLLV